MLGYKPASTPIELNHRTRADLSDTLDKHNYQKLVGRLIYLSHTRPDIAYAVSIVSRYMHDPRTSHMDIVKQILRYLKSCPGKGILFSRNRHLKIEGYTDADWARCLDARRSTSGYCMFIGGNLVSWRSKKQSVVARSTAEAEFRSMASGFCELIWLKLLLKELKLFDSTPLRVYCDNQATIARWGLWIFSPHLEGECCRGLVEDRKEREVKNVKVSNSPVYLCMWRNEGVTSREIQSPRVFLCFGVCELIFYLELEFGKSVFV